MTKIKQDDPSINPLAVTEAPAITGVREVPTPAEAGGAEIGVGQRLASGRFQLTRRLGSGGMGVVFEALDRDSGGHVALKVLPVIEPQALLRFKNEFRLLRDIRHDNLIRLHELIEDNGRWFFTMERIEGIDFLSYVRPGSNVDEERLGASLVQLAHGLEAVHAAGRIHRDVKPSNILVTRAGRLALLDFGVVAEMRAAERFTEAGGLVGTIAYMAPEQGLSDPVGPAADWYSVGVVLYEALAGRIPFRGSALDVLLKKQRSAPPSPRSWDAAAPEAFVSLCLDLLRPEPATRPSGSEVLERLALLAPAPPSARRAAVGATPSSPFVGRRDEIETLEALFRSTRAGNTATVLIYGESGIGKSALLGRFADTLREREPEVIVLSGRCYERESVPYRALDGVVDSLSQIASRLPPGQAELLVPANAALLGEVFPVLLRIEAFARAPRPRHKVMDPQERRTRVFAALREILFRLAERRPVLVAIDDLQWSDADSLALLREILRPIEAPALLLVATVRPPAPEFALPGEVRELQLGRLLREEASELAAALLGDQAGRAAGEIGDEAQGHPLFIQTLARQTREHGTALSESLQLDDAIRKQVAGFDAPVRRLIELVALAGAPIPLESAARAAEVDLGELDRLASILASARLIRTSGIRTKDVIEPYHDRVREAVTARLAAAERRDRHAQLARALPATEAHFEALANHWRGAGDAEQGAKYAVLAAEHATRALAFERAARLYRWALELGTIPLQQAWELEAKVGEALTNAGLGARAADVYLSAARSAQAAGAGALQVFGLRRRAAEELLRSGHFDKGVETLTGVLAEAGVKLPRSASGAIPSILGRRVLIRLRGIGFTERDASAVPAEQLARADACWGGAMGLGLSDFIRGMDLQTRHLLLALRAGEPSRVLRALALETCYTASYGVSTQRRTVKLLEATRRLAIHLDQPLGLSWVPFANGVSSWLQGRFKSGLAACDEAEHSFRDRCTGVTWELSAVRLFAHWCLWALGEYGELSRRAALHLREAEERGDLFAVSSLRTGPPNIIWLAADDPDGALAATEEALRGWSQQGFHLQHFWDMIARAEIWLYLDQARSAYEELMGRWPAFARSLLLRPQMNAMIAFSLRGRCALAAAAASEGSERARLARDAEHCAKRLEQGRVAYATGFAGLLRAGAASVRGDGERVPELWEAAARTFDGADMSLHAGVARRQRGKLIGGSAGAALIAAADELSRGRGIVRPERIAAVLAPCCEMTD